MGSIVLRKVGGFYNSFDNDAIIISYLCNYKLVGGRVGFPIGSLNKVINVLENNNINYIIRENMEDIERKDYKKKNKYDMYLDNGRKKIDIDYRINSIMNRINGMSSDRIYGLLDIIEGYINE